MNRWIGLGRIKHTPKLTNAKSDLPILRLSVMTSQVFDEGQEDIQWHNVVLKGQLAVDWESLLSKGDLISVICELRYYSSNRGGVKRRITELEVKEIAIQQKASIGMEMGDEQIPF